MLLLSPQENQIIINQIIGSINMLFDLVLLLNTSEAVLSYPIRNTEYFVYFIEKFISLKKPKIIEKEVTINCWWRTALMAIEQWGFFNVQHPLRHGPTVYNGHLRGPLTLTPSVWQWSCHYLFYDLGLSGSYPDLPHASLTLYLYATAAVVWYVKEPSMAMSAECRVKLNVWKKLFSGKKTPNKLDSLNVDKNYAFCCNSDI